MPRYLASPDEFRHYCLVRCAGDRLDVLWVLVKLTACGIHENLSDRSVTRGLVLRHEKPGLVLNAIIQLLTTAQLPKLAPHCFCLLLFRVQCLPIVDNLEAALLRRLIFQLDIALSIEQFQLADVLDSRHGQNLLWLFIHSRNIVVKLLRHRTKVTQRISVECHHSIVGHPSSARQLLHLFAEVLLDKLNSKVIVHIQIIETLLDGVLGFWGPKTPKPRIIDLFNNK